MWAGVFWGLWLYPLGAGILVELYSACPWNPAYGRLLCLSSQQFHLVGVAAIRGCRLTMDKSYPTRGDAFHVVALMGAKPKPRSD